jgi:hypothetical protein
MLSIIKRLYQQKQAASDFEWHPMGSMDFQKHVWPNNRAGRGNEGKQSTNPCFVMEAKTNSLK